MGGGHRSRPRPVLRDARPSAALLRTRLRGIANLMVRSAAKPRVSNHGRLAPLSPVAHPSRRAAFGRAPQDEVEGYCKPHGEERGEARVSNHGRLAPLSPAARPSRRAAFGRAPQDEVEGLDGRFCCKQQRIYKAPLMQTPDAFGRRAQFQLWIFSYTILLRPSKKLLSRV